jgi:hypothetical protein
MFVTYLAVQRIESAIQSSKTHRLQVRKAVNIEYYLKALQSWPDCPGIGHLSTCRYWS